MPYRPESRRDVRDLSDGELAERLLAPGVTFDDIATLDLATVRRQLGELLSDESLTDAELDDIAERVHDFCWERRRVRYELDVIERIEDTMREPGDAHHREG